MKSDILNKEIMKLNQRPTKYLESEYERLEGNKDFHEWDEIMIEAIDEAKLRIMNILMERKIQEEIDDEKDHEVDERTGFNDISSSGISI